MTSIAHLVDRSTHSLNPLVFQTPPFLLDIMPLFSTIRRIWYWNTKMHMYSRRENFAKLAAGHITHWVLGDRHWIGIAAHVIYVCKKVLILAEKKQACAIVYKKWIDILKNTYPDSQCYGYFPRIKKICCATWNLLKEFFQFFMCFADTIEAFYLNARGDATNELFVHAHSLLGDLANNKRYLIEELTKQQKLIDQLLVPLHAPFSAKQLISGVSAALTCTETAHYTASKVWQYSGKAFLDGIFAMGHTLVGSGMHWTIALKNPIKN